MISKKIREILRTLTFKLTVSFSIFLGLSLSLLALFFYWSTIGLLVRETDAALNAEINSLADQYNEHGLERLAKVIRFRITQQENREMVYVLANRSGRIVVGNLSRWPEMVLDNENRTEFTHGFKEKQTKTRARVFRLESGVTLLVGRNIGQIQKLRAIFSNSIYGAIALTLIFAILSGLLFSRKMLQRLDSFTTVTADIMQGKLSRRIEETGTLDEFDVLARHLNSMLERLETLVSGVRHVSDNIAHDMRTPLTRLRNRIEGISRKLEGNSQLEVEECVAEADELLNMFSSLLRIARIESGSYGGKFENIDMAIIATDAIELYQGSAEEKGVVIVAQIDKGVHLLGDRHLLFQLLANLIDNAVKYTLDGTSIGVIVEKNLEEVIVLVADNGSGVAAEDYERMSGRFVRLDPSRSLPGSGLGLSLVKVVVDLHKGTIHFSDNRPGLRVEVRVPVSHG